jgi:hypothetical protein
MWLRSNLKHFTDAENNVILYGNMLQRMVNELR